MDMGVARETGVQVREAAEMSGNTSLTQGICESIAKTSSDPSANPLCSILDDPDEILSARSEAKLPWSFWQRYVQTIGKYASIQKIANLGRAYYHYRKGSLRIPTLPAFLKVEISRKCTVNCRYCIERKEDVFYPFDQYRELIDRLKEYLFLVSLYNIGEPLHNENIIEYIRYAHARRIGTVISTSLSVSKPETFWNELVLSGLDRVIVAIDGVTEPVYRQYRRNGNLDLVMSNLESLLRHRSACRRDLIVEWQMLDLPWNKTEQPAARRRAQELGCSRFRVVPEAIRPRLRQAREDRLRERNCILPYLVLIVNAYNRVHPCFKSFEHVAVVGDLAHSTLEEVWNGEGLARIRSKATITSEVNCRTCRE